MSQTHADLARIILAGEYSLSAIKFRLLDAMGDDSADALTSMHRRSRRQQRWLDSFLKLLLKRFPPDRLPPLLPRLKTFLRTQEVEELLPSDLRLDTSRLPPPCFRPLRERFGAWDLPPLVSLGELAHWLNISPEAQDWQSGRLSRARERARYTLRADQTRPGKTRLLEIPCTALKRTQRKILRDILNLVPPHAAAHGFCPGRSVLTNARPHVAAAVVWKLDLANFFLSVRAARVCGVFRMLGYPEAVARALTGLCTHLLSREELAVLLPSFSRDARQELSTLGPLAHLPTGAPTSPALANLTSWRLDARLQGLAAFFCASYTRYADDLTFSGGDTFHQQLARFRIQALAIIADEGFLIRSRKSRIATSSLRQQVTGIVVNARLNPPREEYKLLHAILHNCQRHGPASQNHAGVQNFAEHLRGRIAWVKQLNPARGHKLEEMFDAIDWTAIPHSF